MLKIAVCDDCITLCTDLERMLYEYGDSICESFQIEEYFTGKKLYEDLQKGECFDLIILDIVMPEPNGIKIGRYIREELKNYDVGIIYISSFSEYAMELFKIRPFDFFVKPVKQTQLNKVMEEFVEASGKRHKILQYTKGRKVYIKDILYLTITGRVIEMITLYSKENFYGSLSEIYLKLDARQFFYANKSQIVNYNMVQEFYYDKLVMINSAVIKISQGKRKQVLELHKNYLKREMG